MTNAPESRKTHICRIVGTNRAGERLDDIWVDLERIDVIRSASQLPSDQFQGVQRSIKWCDDPDSEDYAPGGITPSRLTTMVKVCDPNSANVNDPDEWVEVPVIKGMRSKGSVDSMGQGFMDRFVVDNEDGDNTARIVVRRKISHCDTNIDDAAQAAFDADPARREYVVDGQFYQKNLSTKDDSQYVDHEIITFLKNKGNVLDAMGLGRQTKLLNDYLIDESDPAKGEVIGVSGINPPYQLDPFQNIVNCQFAGEKAVFVGLGDRALESSSTFTDLYSEDGFALSSLLNGVCAASGFGRTVVVGAGVGMTATQSDFVAFGKPVDGPACFIIARRSGAIERGVIENGELAWSSVGSLSTDVYVYSCHFAGDAFFIGYKRNDDPDRFFFAVSFDGMAFSLGIEPFPGAKTHANGTGTDGTLPSFIEGGGIAYNAQSRQYVAVGWFQRNAVGEFFNGVILVEADASNLNFVSSSSGNGLSWSPRFNDTETGLFGEGAVGGLGGSDQPFCSVAFGNGRFVACGSRKAAFPQPDFFDVALQSWMAAATTSLDGSSWSAPVDLSGALPATAHTHSTASGVVFCKHRGLGPGIDGFFLMGASGGGDEAPFRMGNLFYSIDGSSWSQVYSSTEFLPFCLSLINKQTEKSVVVFK